MTESEVLLKIKTDKQAQKQTERAIKDTEGALDDLARANQRAFEQSRKSIQAYTDEFDRVSKNVALAGDVQSNLGAAAGLAGAAGLGGAATGIGVAGELIVLTEELPRLKTALAGLPAAAKAAAVSLGPAGIGLAAATLALAAAVKIASDQYAKARKEFEAIQQGQSDYFDIIKQGTSESIQAELDKLNTEIEIARQEQALRDQQLASLREQTGVIGDVFESISKGPLESIGGVGAAAFDTARKAADETKKEVDALTERQQALQRALGDSSIAANDAAEAERRLAQERTTATLQFASDEAARERARVSAENASREANEARLDSIADEKRIIDAELRALKDRNDQSEQVTQRIEQLTQQLSLLGDEAGIVRDQLNRTPDTPRQQDKGERLDGREQQRREKEANKQALDEQIKEREKANGEINEIINRRIEAEKNAYKRLEEERKQALLDAQRDEQDALIGFNRDIADAGTDLRRDERDAEIDHSNDLKKIRDDARKGERDALLNNDFKAAFEIRSGLKDQVDERKEALQNEKSDLRVALGDQLEDLRVALGREGEDRRLAYERQISDAQAKFAEELTLAQSTDAQRLAIAQQTALGIIALEQQIATSRMNGADKGFGRRPRNVTPPRNNGGKGFDKGNTNVNITINGNDEKKIVNTVNRAMNRGGGGEFGR